MISHRTPVFWHYLDARSSGLAFTYDSQAHQMTCYQTLQKETNGKAKFQCQLDGVVFFRYNPYPPVADLYVIGFLEDPVFEWLDSPHLQFAQVDWLGHRHFIFPEPGGYLQVFAKSIAEVET